MACERQEQNLDMCVSGLSQILENLIKIRNKMNDSERFGANGPSCSNTVAKEQSCKSQKSSVSANNSSCQISEPKNQCCSISVESQSSDNDQENPGEVFYPDKYNATTGGTGGTCNYSPATKESTDQTTKSDDAIQRIVAVRENSDGSVSKIYAIRKEVKTPKRNSIRVKTSLSNSRADESFVTSTKKNQTKCNKAQSSESCGLTSSKPSNVSITSNTGKCANQNKKPKNCKPLGKTVSAPSTKCSNQSQKEPSTANVCTCSKNSALSDAQQEDFQNLFEELKMIISKEKERIEAFNVQPAQVDDKPKCSKSGKRVVCPLTEKESTNLITDMIETLITSFDKIIDSLNKNNSQSTEKSCDTDSKNKNDASKNILREIQTNLFDTLSNLSKSLKLYPKVRAPEIAGMLEKLQATMSLQPETTAEKKCPKKSCKRETKKDENPCSF